MLLELFTERIPYPYPPQRVLQSIHQSVRYAAIRVVHNLDILEPKLIFIKHSQSELLTVFVASISSYTSFEITIGIDSSGCA